jgi:17beta-estradiol 17-dehydrogenase / very-long-chain 3-oxoacyl-CoA reductase
MSIQSIFTTLLLFLILFQILLLLIQFILGIYKYFIIKELNLLERYGKESWVIITGASSGQGYDFAISFAKRGFNILMIGSKRCLDTQDFINTHYPNVKTKMIVKDFRKAFEDDFFIDIEKEINTIGINNALLINNVGHRVGWKPYHEMNPNYIRDTIATGTLVQSRMTHMLIPFFLERNKSGVKSGLINITAQCMHPNFLFGITMSNEISVPYLSVYEAANAFGFYQGNSIYKEYEGSFDILNITPGAVITNNTKYLSGTLFNIESKVFVNTIISFLGNIQGTTCGYWGHALSNYLINFAPFIKDRMLRNVGETIAQNFMQDNLYNDIHNGIQNNKYDV